MSRIRMNLPFILCIVGINLVIKFYVNFVFNYFKQAFLIYHRCIPANVLGFTRIVLFISVFL